ncbi:MAG: glycoside hydrolase family 25 protein [Lachnospiraceae bacterium]|nr:glycoside hydrolase family 25 protein [Lachnospiraceae bacterium]MDD7027614.1 glycoside hydrolase family 25 protein [Lachnospiraceae bacterium]MDY5701616.1 glycoside hydrolase family 25 protein [Lachnospiraceae bacterium]
MRQTNDYEDNSGGLPLIGMALGVSFFVLLVLLLVVSLNKNNRPRKQPQAVAASSEEESAERFVAGGDLVASDLDFWDMYPLEEETTTEEEETEEETTTQEDPATDGKHVEVVYRDGTSEWLEINPKWKKNTYDFTNLVSKNNLLRYYSDGKQASYLGIDLSRYQKSVNYEALKNEGIDFCMLRVGGRGYETGVIQADEMFDTHIAGVTKAGLDVGLYFYSQAVTEAEAIEEANYLLSKIGTYKITYPIAFDMEYVDNDTSRIETLTKAEKTKIALAFLNRIEQAGYTGMLYGNKEWLLTRIDLSQFEQFDIWLAQEADIPDYPYTYSMWEYTRKGEIYGIDGYVDLNISFIDYSAR